VVADGDGRVLLLRHTYTPGWHFPGGGVERGETCGLALRRELKEEAGVEAAESAMELVSVHANHVLFPNDHVVLFRIRHWIQGEATQRGEIAEVRFFDPLDPPEGVSAATRRRLDELFGGRPPSELW
jgi:8-oxo-dGTP pyrophosphatase MutT (NUDIX family)